MQLLFFKQGLGRANRKSWKSLRSDDSLLACSIGAARHTGRGRKPGKSVKEGNPPLPSALNAYPRNGVGELFQLREILRGKGCSCLGRWSVLTATPRGRICPKLNSVQIRSYTRARGYLSCPKPIAIRPARGRASFFAWGVSLFYGLTNRAISASGTPWDVSEPAGRFVLCAGLPVWSCGAGLLSAPP